MNKKIKLSVILIIIAAAIAFALMRFSKKGPEEAAKEISPFMGNIENIVSTTGTVQPKNRLAIKPPVNGRVDKILVKEGENVKVGQVLAVMSSTERAALLDAAQSQGTEQVKYWEQVYKPILLLAPINGQVIVATIQPGQTVTIADAVVVLSDQLIVRAQVDETDIGKVKLGQAAVVSLDAYPDVKVNAAVDHIYYESRTVNNVTIYDVDLIPEEVLPFFRSGMNTTINFITASKKNILLVPLEAVHKDKEGTYVLRAAGAKEPVRQYITLGMTDDKNAEVVSGVGAQDKIIIKLKSSKIPKAGAQSSNPFMPFGARRTGGGGGSSR